MIRNTVTFLAVALFLANCESSTLEKQLIGYYNIRTMELAVEDTTLDYLPPYLLFFHRDNSCGIPFRDDLSLSSLDKCKWELIKKEGNIHVKINSDDSLFNDPFKIRILDYHYFDGNPVQLKSFTLTNQFVYIEAYIE